MADICFAWQSAWPHAVPDLRRVRADPDPRKVTCPMCRHALGSQKDDPPLEPTVRQNLASAWTAYAMSTVRSGPPLGSPQYSNGLLDVLEREVNRMLVEAKRDLLAPVYALGKHWNLSEDRTWVSGMGEELLELVDGIARSEPAVPVSTIPVVSADGPAGEST